MAVESKKLNKIILYRTIAARHFSNETIELMKTGKIDSVMLYSQYSSLVFQQLIAKHEMEEKARHIKYYCLSLRIAQFMQKKGYNECIVSDHPNQDSLVSSIIKN